MGKTLIVSPCGTSLLTSGAGEEARRLISKYANAGTLEEIPAGDRERVGAIVEAAASRLAGADDRAAAASSAELNGIIAHYGGRSAGGDHHILLGTDTLLGDATAHAVADWLRGKGCSAEALRQKDLRTSDLASFGLALSEIVKWCDETVADYRTKGYRVVFNLTGGFKCVQGFLQTLASFYADEAVYIFETSGELLRIPRLPIRMDALDAVRGHLAAFRRLSLHLPAGAGDGMPETLLFEVGGETSLSPWGEIVWRQSRGELYRERVLPAPFDGIGYGAGFEKSVAGLVPEKKERINRKIDDLARFLLSGRRDNPRSLDFKELRGKPCPPSTHEIDAWADEDAARLFGHFEGERFVLDRLGKALH